MVVAEQAITVPSIAATAGYDSSVITGNPSPDAPHNGLMRWGTATGVYSHQENIVHTTPTTLSDGTTHNLAKWTIYGLQGAVDQAYFATIIWDDATTTGETTFTIKGLNAGGTDTVRFAPRNINRLHRIAEIAEKAAVQGWLDPQEFSQFLLLCFSAAEYNSIVWADGR